MNDAGGRLAGSLDAPLGVIADRFELLVEAGAGAMGTIYRARDLQTDDIVALKVLKHGGDLERFTREAEVLAELSHDAVVRYIAHGTTPDGEPYLAMEWLEGETLRSFLARTTPSLEDIVVLGEHVASALAAAHGAGIVHRDLKPSNLFLVGGSMRRVKVLDFGIARVDGADRELTHTGQVIGTPGYMSPEQARGQRELDGRADLFSLGCVLYRCVAGNPPFEAQDVLSVLAALVLTEPPPLRSTRERVPAALEALVSKLLAKTPDARPASAGDVERSLSSIRERLEKGAEEIEEAPLSAEATQKTMVAGIGGATNEVKRAFPALPKSASRQHGPSRTLFVFGSMAAIAFVGVAAFVTLRGESRSSTSVGTADSASVTPLPIGVSSDIAAQSCRNLAASLVRMQRKDGSFGLEAQRPATAWPTAQALTALAMSRKSCAGAGVDTIENAIAALDRFRIAERWTETDEQTEGGTLAWAALAFATASEEVPSAKGSALALRDVVVKRQQEDGRFLFKRTGTREADDFVTLMTVSALCRLEASDPGAGVPDVRERASKWLRASLRGEEPESKLSSIPEFRALSIRVLVDLHNRCGDREEGDDQLLTGLAQGIAGHCELSNATPPACARPIAADEIIKLDAAFDPNFALLWFPWTISATDAALSDASFEPDPALERDLRSVLAWALAEGERGGAMFSAAPTYKVADQLIAVSHVIDDPPKTR
ncbi:MAG: serine/threonine protein kinase [Polyangiaceae bacterium]|nr:serine/threonine protein kinase [Polyangiaceae bacterium]